MIVLDTNVLSEPLKAHPDPVVVTWLNGIAEQVAITSITAAEILAGVRLLPAGRRRDDLGREIGRVLDDFADRVLPFDAVAARLYADFRAARSEAGHPLSVEDGMIAAICSSRGTRLATRNTKDFDGLGLDLVDPWAG